MEETSSIPNVGSRLESCWGEKGRWDGIFHFLVFRALQQMFQPPGSTFLEKNKL